jgi:hypothetical protein
MNVFDFVKSISYEKNDLLLDNDEREYVPFVVNRAFSLYTDTLFYANEMNKLHHLDKKMQHDYLFKIVPKKKRFVKWPKKLNEDENVACIAEYYKYSTTEAKSVLSLLTDEQLAKIKKELEQGGVK